MRKFFNIFLVFLLLFSTAGMAISKHYCGELLQKVTVEKPTSCCNSEDMPEDCCSNEAASLKADELQLSSLELNLEFTPFLLYITHNLIQLNAEQTGKGACFIQHNIPPPLGQDIFIRVQSFLI